MTYPILVQCEYMGGFTALMPDFPGCTPEGDDMDDLMSRIQPDVEAWMAEKGLKVLPAPSSMDVVMNTVDSRTVPLLVEIDDAFLIRQVNT